MVAGPNYFDFIIAQRIDYSVSGFRPGTVYICDLLSTLVPESLST